MTLRLDWHLLEFDVDVAGKLSLNLNLTTKFDRCANFWKVYNVTAYRAIFYWTSNLLSCLSFVSLGNYNET